MSGLACGLIVIVPLAPSWLLGGLIQLVLPSLEHMANRHVDIPNQAFRYFYGNPYHPVPPCEVSRAI
jgi:hypothetical protein